MKRNFVTGLLSGLCGTIVLFAVVIGVYFFAGGRLITNAQHDIEDGAENNQTVGTQQVSDKEAPFKEVVSKLSFLETLVDKYYLNDVNPDAFADGIYKGFMSSLKDPYSTYYTKEEYSALMDSSSGSYCGIGATVSQDVKTGIITVVKPFETGPAQKAGILPGDILYTVDGEKVTGLDLTQVVSKMKGKEGTEVQIAIVREGVTEPMNFTITRGEVEVPTVSSQMLKGKIGYIIISEFDEITVGQFVSAVDKLEKDGMKGLVVDVRNNPGGMLTSVVSILDRLLPKGLVVYTEDKYGNRVEQNAKDAIKINVPMAVLINGNSASASEIFAGTIQDDKAGTIIGTTSFGKGIVQKVIPLTDGTAVKMTISKYYTPKGRNIQGIGITPDIKVELNDDLRQMAKIPLDKDNQLQEAIKCVKDQIK